MAQAGEEAADQLEFDLLFSTRKPKDVRAGLASGVKSVAKGVLAGAIGLVAAPAIGAHQEGFKGFAKGAAAGLAGAVLLPVTGVAVGTAQLVRGAVNTPDAIKQAKEGRVWDEEGRRWIEPPGLALVAEDEGTRAARAEWQRAQRRARGEPEGDDFYALLGVERDASPEEIKRQYYILARRTHPDKNPDDPEAKEKFQRLGEAFQVLGNAELRKRYDAHGAQALDVNFVDASDFFAALFGSDRFEHLVGELMLAAAARHDFNPSQLKRVQHAREERLAVMLSALLRRYVEGDAEGFQESMRAEAAELSSASFGDVMLAAIGGVYKAQADIFLGGVLDGSLAALRAKGQSVKAQFSAASLAIKVYKRQVEIAKLDAVEQAAKEAAQPQRQPVEQAAGEAAQQGAAQQAAQQAAQEQQQEHEGALSPEQQEAAAAAALAAVAAAAERAALEEQSLPLMLDAMWAANRLDIEATLRHVCRRLLGDDSVSKAHRRLRAEALRELGRIFLEAARQAKAERDARTAAAAGSAAPAGSSNGSRRQTAGGEAAAAGSSSGGGGNGAEGSRRATLDQRRQRREEEERQRQEEAARAAKQQMEDAMMAVMQRRMQQEEGPAR